MGEFRAHLMRICWTVERSSLRENITIIHRATFDWSRFCWAIFDKGQCDNCDRVSNSTRYVDRLENLKLGSAIECQRLKTL